MDCSSTLVMQGLAVEARGDSSAVYCCKEGHAELSGCKLTSPEGTGLWVDGNYGSATVTMDGGAISGCGEYGVYCTNSTATVRPPAAAPSAAPIRCGRGGVSSPLFSRRFFVVSSNRRAKNRHVHKRVTVRLSVRRAWAVARGHR
eukprot:COSAG04_NODE_137_length_23739_cov_18.665764_15_plen_145_part_00